MSLTKEQETLFRELLLKIVELEIKYSNGELDPINYQIGTVELYEPVTELIRKAIENND